jgi:hypothetical protein
VTETKTSFKKRAVALFKSTNPKGTTITWTYGPVAVTWSDGTKGWSGTFDAARPGYRNQRMVATLMDGQVSVR